MSGNLSGRCLCGACSFRSVGEAQFAGHCHCVDCRKASGAGHCTHVVVSGEGFESEGPVRLYDKPADSGSMVTRAFCEVCGSPLYSMNNRMPGMVFLRAGALDDPDAVSPQMTVYARRAPAWDRAGEGLPRFDLMPTEMPV